MSFSRTISMYALLAVFMLAAQGDVVAQSLQSRAGVVRLTEWPGGDEMTDALRTYDVLPTIDTLTFGYGYAPSAPEPLLSLALEWKLGSTVIYDGRRIPISALADTVRMAAIDLSAGVYSGGQKVGTFRVQIDSMLLAPYPDFTQLELAGLAWDELFVGMPGWEARAVYRAGFELRDLEIESAAFVLLEKPSTAGVEREQREVRRPRRVAVYRRDVNLDVFISLDWLIRGFGTAPTHYRPVKPDGRRGQMGRGSLATGDRDRTGRGRAVRSSGEGARNGDGADWPSAREVSRGVDGANRPTAREAARGGDSADRSTAREAARGGESADRSTAREAARGGESADRSTAREGSRGNDGEKATAEKRRGSSSRSSKDDDEDDDDEKKWLMPASLTALAAVAALGYAGGTIGYYGDMRYAPLGLSSGFVRPRGGILLQAAINEEMLGGGGTGHLLAKATGFMDVWGMPLQPAIGVGMLASESGGVITRRTALSVGMAANFGPLLLIGTYDLSLDSFDVGVALNFRHRGVAGARK